MEQLKQHVSEGLIVSTWRHETQSSNSVRKYSDSPIPDDLLVEIFSRVPLKSIARFCSVSKFLASILGRHDFTELFLTKSLTRPRLLFTVKSKDKLLFYTSPQPHNPDNEYSLVVVPYPKFLHHSRYIYKPVCGLVLILGWGRKQKPVICNPAKRKFQTLPKVPRYEKDTPRGIYLGYDPMAKQFKVLCMSMNTGTFIPNTHWILTLESGECLWRSLEPNFFNLREDSRLGSDICINGVLYFEGVVEGSFVIACFDVRSEKFSFISNKDEEMIPKHNDHCTSPSTLFNYKGKLGIHRWVEQKLVLWVVEDAINHKWAKHSYVLSPFGSDIVRVTMFAGMTSTGEIVYSSSYCIFFYNIEKNTFSRVNIKGLEGLNPRIIYCTFVDYLENLKFV